MIKLPNGNYVDRNSVAAISSHKPESELEMAWTVISVHLKSGARIEAKRICFIPGKSELPSTAIDNIHTMLTEAVQ